MTMTDRELFDAMTHAAWRATEAAVAAGHRRYSKVVKDSAYQASLAVFRAERPDEAPGAPQRVPAVIPLGEDHTVPIHEHPNSD